MAKKVFWRSGNCKRSGLALHRLGKKCFGVPGMSRKVFWRWGNGKKNVCVGVAGVGLWGW